MTNDEKTQLQAAIDILNKLKSDIPATEKAINNETDFNLALANSNTRNIVLSPDFNYSKPLIISRPLSIVNQDIISVVIRRAEKADHYPTFREGITILDCPDVYLDGLDVRKSDGSTIIDISKATKTKIYQCKILGDSFKGNKRGIRANGGDMSIVKCYIDDIKRIGQDSQAIFTSDMVGPGLYIDDCYLSAAAEAFMAGGEDPSEESHVPSKITLINSTLTKNPAWYGENQQIKNAFELKNANGVRVQNCIMEYAGISQGQGGYIFVLTVRNQDGKAPYSNIKDVSVKDCVARYAGGGINFLGADNNHPSGTMENVIFDNIHFMDIDPKGITKGSGHGFQFGAAPKGITLQNITIDGQNLAAPGYFMKPPPIRLIMKNIKTPLTSTYGWKIDAGKSGFPALKELMPDAVIEITPTDTGSSI